MYQQLQIHQILANFPIIIQLEVQIKFMQDFLQAVDLYQLIVLAILVQKVLGRTQDL